MTDAPASEPAVSNVPEYSVSELAFSLKKTVEDAYGFVRVRGELGRTLIARSGHFYADLKDEKAVISGVMWKGNVARLNFKPEEGLEVVVEGKLSTYPGRSQYQIIIDRMAPAGAGALMALLEERKKKLAAEGLFDPERKRRPPFLPDVIGVVTSPTGAVIRDILHRITDRFPRHVLVWPVLVQGEQAAEQIAGAIKGFNALPDAGPVPRPDVLIVARGGGSIEDLWSFNEEMVVRAAAASEIPLVSAVGHETDTTLIDYAADVRAPTPTGAAEMVVPVRAELVARVDTLQGRLGASMTRALERRKVDVRAASRGLPRPDDILGQRAQRLDSAGQALRAGLKSLADAAAVRFSRVSGRLRAEALTRDLTLKRERMDELAARAGAQAGRTVTQSRQRMGEASNRLQGAGRRQLAQQAQRLQAVAGRLESVNPKAVLGRGYALVHRAEGGLARRADDLVAGDAVALEFADGRRGAVIAEGEADAGKADASRGRGKSRARGGGDTGPSSSDTGQGALF